VDHNLSKAQGAMINSFLNGASFFGRFAGGVFGDRFGLVNLTLFCAAASALTTLVIWMFATSLPVLLVYVILYGLMGGGFISLLVRSCFV
jgi:MFS family permease